MPRGQKYKYTPTSPFLWTRVMAALSLLRCSKLIWHRRFILSSGYHLSNPFVSHLKIISGSKYYPLSKPSSIAPVEIFSNHCLCPFPFIANMVLPSLPSTPLPDYDLFVQHWYEPDHATIDSVWDFYCASNHPDFDYEYVLKCRDYDNTSHFERYRRRFKQFVQTIEVAFWNRQLLEAGPWAIQELNEVKERKQTTNVRIGLDGQMRLREKSSTEDQAYSRIWTVVLFRE